jgi:hypothetical protein
MLGVFVDDGICVDNVSETHMDTFY